MRNAITILYCCLLSACNTPLGETTSAILKGLGDDIVEGWNKSVEERSYSKGSSSYSSSKYDFRKYAHIPGFIRDLGNPNLPQAPSAHMIAVCGNDGNAYLTIYADNERIMGFEPVSSKQNTPCQFYKAMY